MVRTRRCRFALMVAACLAPLAHARGAHAQPVEGFGSKTNGGAGGEVYHVTTLADSGSGSLRYALNNRTQKPLTILFDVGGTITLTNDIVINQPFLTIDGTTAPSPGITITHNTIANEFMIGGTHDIIIRNMRFRSIWVDGDPLGSYAIFTIDGDSPPDRVAQRIVLDHIVVTKAGDAGPDIWGEARDITFQWSMFFASLHPSTISGYGPLVNTTRQRISLHHNVYAVNSERNPQLRADVRVLDYVNNVIYGWGSMPKSNPNSGYGVRIRNEPDEPKVNGVNIVNNAFVSIPGNFPQWALVYGDSPGADLDDGGPAQVLKQGEVYTESRMGDLWVSGNILPKANKDQYSTVAHPIPIAYPVTTMPVTQLKDDMIPLVGMKYRTATEQQLLDTIADALAGQPGPGPSPSPSPSPTPKPSPSPSASPTPSPTPSPSPTATPKPSPSPSPREHEHREERGEEHKGQDGWTTFKRRVEQLYCRVTGC